MNKIHSLLDGSCLINTRGILQLIKDHARLRALVEKLKAKIWELQLINNHARLRAPVEKLKAKIWESWPSINFPQVFKDFKDLFDGSEEFGITRIGTKKNKKILVWVKNDEYRQNLQKHLKGTRYEGIMLIEVRTTASEIK